MKYTYLSSNCHFHWTWFPSATTGSINPAQQQPKRHLRTKLSIHSWMSELCKTANLGLR